MRIPFIYSKHFYTSYTTYANKLYPIYIHKHIYTHIGVKVEHDHDVGAVIVGFDQNINYYKIQYAQLCINENKDCKLHMCRILWCLSGNSM